MVWFEVTTVSNEKHLINVNNVIDVYYTAETDMTVITTSLQSLYVRGNKLSEISKLINRNDRCVLHRIGE